MGLSIGEFARQTGVTPRTVRYYVELGLLPPPHGGGRVASYGSEHLRRMDLIRKLQAGRLSLDEIRDQLAAMTPADATEMAALSAPAPESAMAYIQRLREQRTPYGDQSANFSASTAQRPSERGDNYISEPWTRIPLSEDVELHVKRRGNRIDRRISRLVEEARRILSEEESR